MVRRIYPTLRLSTSRSIASSVFSLRSRASSTRSSLAQRAVRLTAAAPFDIDPVPSVPSFDAQVPGHLRDRLAGLPDQPPRALPEVPMELPAGCLAGDWSGTGSQAAKGNGRGRRAPPVQVLRAPQPQSELSVLEVMVIPVTAPLVT
jgi:hypothetical protein